MVSNHRKGVERLRRRCFVRVTSEDPLDHSRHLRRILRREKIDDWRAPEDHDRKGVEEDANPEAIGDETPHPRGDSLRRHEDRH